MRRGPLHALSFRQKLRCGFLLIGVVPLLLCMALSLGIFQAALTQREQDSARWELEQLQGGLDQFLITCQQVMEQLRDDELVRRALSGERAGSVEVYDLLYTASAPLRSRADVSLYSAGGEVIFSTASRPERQLPPYWGLLAAAASEEAFQFRSVPRLSDAAAGDCLRAACAVQADGRTLGYVVTGITERQMAALLGSGHSAAGSVALLDPWWGTVYCAQKRLSDQVPLLRAELMETGRLSAGRDDYSYYVSQSGHWGLYLLMQQPRLLSGGTLRLLGLVDGVLLALCLGLCAALSMSFSRQLVQPVQALNDAMGEMEGGNLDVRVDGGGTDELGQLAGHFNRMAGKLRDNLAESLNRQKQLNDAQIRMMQAQLNPHFLYNTLDTIKWMGKINRIPEIATISTDLADILRSSISSREFVPLEQELRLFARYVEIQNIRFPDKFDFQVEVEQRARGALVPKLMLQPLVENAIVHGFADSDRGCIAVTAAVRGEQLQITVADDGCGMTPESLRRFRERGGPASGHLGLYNVDAILRLHYGPERGLRFLTPEGGRGTVIEITLPLNQTGAKEETPC